MLTNSNFINEEETIKDEPLIFQPLNEQIKKRFGCAQPSSKHRIKKIKVLMKENFTIKLLKYKFSLEKCILLSSGLE